MTTPVIDTEFLRRMQDREEITQVLFNFARGVDDLDWEAVGECFANDVHWDYGPGAGAPVDGRDELKAFVRESFSGTAVSGDSKSVVRIKRTSHHVSNIRIDFEDADSARSEAYVFTWHEMIDNDRPGLVWGRWDDRWTRSEDEGWRIASRRMLVSATDNYFAIGYSVWDRDVAFENTGAP